MITNTHSHKHWTNEGGHVTSIRTVGIHNRHAHSKKLATKASAKRVGSLHRNHRPIAKELSPSDQSLIPQLTCRYLVLIQHGAIGCHGHRDVEIAVCIDANDSIKRIVRSLEEHKRVGQV
jgi:hypothetical protein